MTESRNDQIERRQFFRLDMEKEIVDIFLQDENGQSNQKKIACLNFSQAALKLECDQDLPLQTTVKIVFHAKEAKSQNMFGQVLRCSQKDHGWFEIVLMLARN
ncbi:MAG: PilZ domain-containing protein [Alteromonadaceae bacterium]|nr:PilZ domain-containing protein [Alteromonadaceae bacterium]